MTIPYMLERISRMDERQLWADESPIWARPQDGEMKLYSDKVFQVVGHTPVPGIIVGIMRKESRL